MGQNFRLVAPRAKMSLPWGGKLGEMLFDGSPKVLVQLLAVPVPPKNLSSISEEIPMDRHAKRKADGEVLAGPPRHYKRAKRKGCDDTADTDYSMTLSDRPIEVHQLIFSYIESIEEVICLSLANRHFWKVGRERMHDIYASFLGRWAGKNIVCVGEDVQPDDYPPGLFSAEELDVLRHKTSDIPYDFDYPDDVADPNVSFKDVCLFNKSLSLVGHFSMMGISKDAAFASTCSEMLVKEETYFPKVQPWILRNLTAREFVRSEAIAPKPEFIRGPNIDVLGFGEIVISRICWSTSSYGVWVEHCFDITTLARHEGETKGIGWSDVSIEVTSELAGIWESEYGTDWRETVCNLWCHRSSRPTTGRPVAE
ncbi:hypothetical protein EDB80DRAFT_767970 [Ilyonectria destructans]|nr:hypothetical protein EDB80DRAFT_767970 [Ilyonectria destructans]